MSQGSEISVYQRSDALTVLLNSRPEISNPVAPEQNLLLLEYQQRVAQLSAGALIVRQQIEQVRQITDDTEAAIEVLEEMNVVEQYQAKADHHYLLGQQAYKNRLQELRRADVLGKPQSVATAQPQSA
jgi:hypothetical protein